MPSRQKSFDFKHPDYVRVFAERGERLAWLRAHQLELPGVRAHYKKHPEEFINDWGVTYDPRNISKGISAVVPFLLFDRQREFVLWLMEMWTTSQSGIAEKSRDMGLSWLTVSAACTLCLFYESMAVGFGSRKEEYVDRIGSPKSLFFKARMFMDNLPMEFRGGWSSKKDAPHMRLNFPATGSNMSGEAGDNIGRGDRTGIYIVDESAYLERPDLVDASLSQTTNCRIDISSANGTANSFYNRRMAAVGSNKLFTFHWRDDPRKDDAWYENEKIKINNPIIVAQEIDIDYTASVEGVLIPSAWVQAVIDAHVKLGFHPTGQKAASLDVADEGQDLNAFCGAHGIVVQVLEEWSGKGGDIFATTQKAFDLCDRHGYKGFRYDADGLGSGVRGDARVINERRKVQGQAVFNIDAFRGSAGVFAPTQEDVKGRKNEDFFANAKAQAWWSLRLRFQKTYNAINKILDGREATRDEMISLPANLPMLNRLQTELSQPTFSINGAGKIVVDKAPDGSKSPNLADAIMIRFANIKTEMIITDAMLARSRQQLVGAR